MATSNGVLSRSSLAVQNLFAMISSMKQRYKIIRKADGRLQKIASSRLLTNDLGPATVEVTDYHKQERAADNLIYYVRQGRLNLIIDGETINLDEGDVCFIDKNTDYEIRGTASFMLMKKPLFGSVF